MDYKQLINNAFINPKGNNREQIEITIKLFTDELLNYLCIAQFKRLLPPSLSYSFQNNVLNKEPLQRSDILELVRERWRTLY